MITRGRIPSENRLNAVGSGRRAAQFRAHNPIPNGLAWGLGGWVASFS